MPKRGRKRIYTDPMDSYNVRMTPTQARKARKLGNGNMGEGARKALDDAPWPEPKTISDSLPPIR